LAEAEPFKKEAPPFKIPGSNWSKGVRNSLAGDRACGILMLENRKSCCGGAALARIVAWASSMLI